MDKRYGVKHASCRMMGEIFLFSLFSGRPQAQRACDCPRAQHWWIDALNTGGLTAVANKDYRLLLSRAIHDGPGKNRTTT